MKLQIGKELMAVANRALKTNITALAPLVLPVSEQLAYAWNYILRKVMSLIPRTYTYS